jgi:hypothetical protein
MSNPWPNGLHIPMKGETIINKHTEKINCWKIISAMGKKNQTKNRARVSICQTSYNLKL